MRKRTQIDRLRTVMMGLIENHDWGSDEFDGLHLGDDGNPQLQVKILVSQVFNTTLDMMELQGMLRRE